METLIDSTVPETHEADAGQTETQRNSEFRNHLTGWLILAACAILALLICKIVMLELEVHGLLDGLYAAVSQSPLPKT